MKPKHISAKKLSPRTAAIYDQAVELWESLTSNPTLGEIDGNQDVCERFVAGLESRPGVKKSSKMSADTIRKLCSPLQKILNLAGAPCPWNRRQRIGARILQEVPYIERPELTHNPPDGDFTLHEIELWLGACDQAPRCKNLQGLDPFKFHTSLVLFCYNTALRIDTAMTASWEMVDRKRPGWISIPPSIYKGRKYGGDFYLNAFARAAIESIRTSRSDLLFPWRGWPSSQSWLQEQRRVLLALTAIPAHRRFGYHGLRKACLTWLAERNPMIAAIVGGHRGGVTQEHYVNPRIVASLLDKLPQPKLPWNDPQHMLF